MEKIVYEHLYIDREGFLIQKVIINDVKLETRKYGLPIGIDIEGLKRID